MLISDLSELSKNKLLNIGFSLKDSIDFVDEVGHGNVFGFYIDAPIHYAAREGDLDLLQELCDKGANINILCGTHHWTPIMWAGRYGRKDVVCYLIEKGANLTHKAPYEETKFLGEDGDLRIETRLVPCEEKGKYPHSWGAGYDLKSLVSERNTLFSPTFFWTQYQKLLLGKQVDYSGTEALIDENLNTFKQV